MPYATFYVKLQYPLSVTTCKINVVYIRDSILGPKKIVKTVDDFDEN